MVSCELQIIPLENKHLPKIFFGGYIFVRNVVESIQKTLFKNKGLINLKKGGGLWTTQPSFTRPLTEVNCDGLRSTLMG